MVWMMGGMESCSGGMWVWSSVWVGMIGGMESCSGGMWVWSIVCLGWDDGWRKRLLDSNN